MFRLLSLPKKRNNIVSPNTTHSHSNSCSVPVFSVAVFLAFIVVILCMDVYTCTSWRKNNTCTFSLRGKSCVHTTALDCLSTATFYLSTYVFACRVCLSTTCFRLILDLFWQCGNVLYICKMSTTSFAYGRMVLLNAKIPMKLSLINDVAALV